MPRVRMVSRGVPPAAPGPASDESPPIPSALARDDEPVPLVADPALMDVGIRMAGVGHVPAPPPVTWRYVVHNLVAHPLLAVAGIVERFGEWLGAVAERLHERTEP